MSQVWSGLDRFRLTWKWGGRTDPLKSGILSSEANPEKNTHCSSQVGHIIGTVSTWIFRKCQRKKIFVHNFCHNRRQTILHQFDHCPARLLHHMDFPFSMFSYLSQSPFVWPWDRFHTSVSLIFTVHFCLINAFSGTLWIVSVKWRNVDYSYAIFIITCKHWNIFRCDCVYYAMPCILYMYKMLAWHRIGLWH